MSLKEQRYYYELIEQAAAFAAYHHKDQKDKSGNAYITHPLRVMCYVAHNPLAAITALLHDVIEDTDVCVNDLEQQGFPSEVCEAVDAISRRPQEEYFDYVYRCCKNPLALMVKEADLLDNMNVSRLPTLQELDLERVKRYHRALQIVRQHKEPEGSNHE